MASSEPPASDEPLDLAPGEAVLAQLEGQASPLEHLPRRAYENLLVVTVDSPDRVERTVRERGGNPANVGVVPVSASPVNDDGPCWTAERVSPSDLTGISIQYSRGERYLRDGSGWVVVDGLGTLLMYAEAAKLSRLLSQLVGRARERGLRHVTGVATDVVSTETIARYRDVHGGSVSFE